MKRLVISGAIAILVLPLAVLAHLAAIEIGREVVTLRTPLADGASREIRLWIVDDAGTPWLHSGGAEWRRTFDGDPIVEVERVGDVRRYRAHAVPGPHPRIDQLLRAKYGRADRWVRFVSPCGEHTVPVRLEPIS
jgi:hypothetical protein